MVSLDKRSKSIDTNFMTKRQSQEDCSPFSGRAQILPDDSLGSPGPASLTAVTRYSYSLLGVTLSSTKFVPWKQKHIFHMFDYTTGKKNSRISTMPCLLIDAVYKHQWLDERI